MKLRLIPTLFVFCFALSLATAIPAFADVSVLEVIDVTRDGIQETGLPEINDQNINGIPDEWEKEFKLSPGQTAADSDQDSDGFTLIQEYEAKTDPTDPKSHPKYITQVFVSAISRQSRAKLWLFAYSTRSRFFSGRISLSKFATGSSSPTISSWAM